MAHKPFLIFNFLILAVHLHTVVIYLQEALFMFALLTNPSATICQQNGRS